MKTVGIIAEYNPFHLGHAYQMKEAKRRAGADAVVVVMSGNYTQRGEPAVVNKFARAEMALFGGADLVVELPVSFAAASAERFAYGGVSLLSIVADVLSFGSENDDAALLCETAEKVTDRAFLEEVKSAMKNGSSYASARAAVLHKYFPEGAALLSQPNNILAVEYIKAISSLESPLSILPIPRRGSCHNATSPEGGMASASAIRNMPFYRAVQYLPRHSAEILIREKAAGRLMETGGNWETAMLASLRKMTLCDLAALPDAKEGLENRLYDAIHSQTTLDAIISKTNSRRYPSSRIRRMLLQSFLGITADEMRRFPQPLYIRVLAFNQTGRRILSSLRGGALPVITRGAAYHTMSADAQIMFEREITADDIYTSLYPSADARKALSDLYTSPVIL